MSWCCLHSVYNAVKDRGQPAVDALEEYQQVVDTLQSSLEMAQAAITTMREAVQQLAAVSVSELEARAAQSLTDSTVSRDEASMWNNVANSENCVSIQQY